MNTNHDALRETQFQEWCARHDLPPHLSREAFDDAATLSQPMPEAAAQGWKLVPVEPTPEMVSAGLKYCAAGNVYRAMISASPAAPGGSKPDNWQQYAQDGENAQQCIERHRKEHDALLWLLIKAKRPYSGNEEMKL